ncbi:hypothetical protein [Streptomyces halobius]|uniref:CARDB domain-containing protein n=1 Tax=Streptomyces halobius TaxID=2879846 RepID=A0ABY4MGA9_9ACTN|nr:hypothetical protein [Streptomyces halobius]UQA96705.1 hypothetical protein K9S39_36875 [Streptomyces halobius]
MPGPSDYQFGTVDFRKGNGDVLVYKPRKAGGRITVPVTITNNGPKRAFYTVTVTVTAPGGISFMKTIQTSTTGVYPATTWPQEITITEKTDAPAKNYTIKSVDVQRDER